MCILTYGPLAYRKTASDFEQFVGHFRIVRLVRAYFAAVDCSHFAITYSSSDAMVDMGAVPQMVLVRH